MMKTTKLALAGAAIAVLCAGAALAQPYGGGGYGGNNNGGYGGNNNGGYNGGGYNGGGYNGGWATVFEKNFADYAANKG